jgi:hypothetical protein
MTTASVIELRRLSPHATTLGVPGPSAPSTSPGGENLGVGELTRDRGAARGSRESRR